MPEKGIEKGFYRLKEIIICVVIISSILLGNNMIQAYIEESEQELSDELLTLRENLVKEDIDNQQLKNKMDNVYQKWEGRHDKLAYFIEHNELEKIETELTEIKSHIETKQYQEAISELDKSVFLLKHIQDKYAFNMQNVF